MYQGLSVGALIAAGGRGTRMSGDRKKQLLALASKPILVHTIERFQACREVDLVVLIAPGEDAAEVGSLVASYSLTKVCAVVPGGPERGDSVWNGMKAFDEHPVDLVIVHDAVRPFVDRALIRAVLAAAAEHGAALAAVPSKETVKVAEGTMDVALTPARETVWMAQTPQAFRAGLLRRAYEKARADGYAGTDDAALVERIGERVRLVNGSYDNIKITTDADLELAGLIARRWRDAG